MPRPVKWSRNLHPLRDHARLSRTETWSRQDIEVLFGISRPSAQSLMKAIGGVQTVGAAHFIDRASLLAFLDDMIAADSVEVALQRKLADAEPAPRPRTLQVSLPAGLRRAMLPDLPPNVTLSPGRIEIRADSATGMLEALLALAMVMQNDLDRWQQAIETPPMPSVTDEELKGLLAHLRSMHAD